MLPSTQSNLQINMNQFLVLLLVRGNHSGDGRPGSQMSFLDQFLKDTNAHHRSSSQQLHHQQQQQQQHHQLFDRSAHRASQDSLGAAAAAAAEVAAAANRDSVGSSR